MYVLEREHEVLAGYAAPGIMMQQDTQAPHSSTSGLKTISRTRMGGTNIYARSPGVQILTFKLVGINMPGVMVS